MFRRKDLTMYNWQSEMSMLISKAIYAVDLIYTSWGRSVPGYGDMHN